MTLVGSFFGVSEGQDHTSESDHFRSGGRISIHVI